MIRELAIPEAANECYSTGTEGNRIEKLTQLNVFIGPNNSGKSRLLREIFASNVIEATPNDERSDAVRACLQQLHRYLDHTFASEPSATTLREALPRLFPPLSRRGPHNPHDKLSEIVKSQYKMLVGFTEQYGPAVRLQNQGEVGKEIFRQFVLLRGHFQHLTQQTPPLPDMTRLYIPALRGLRPIGDSASIYRDRTIKDYFKSNAQFARQGATDNQEQLAEIRILTGLELYEQVKNHLLGSLDQRKLIRDFEQYLGRTFFDNLPVTLIPRVGDDALHVKIGSEAERPIYHLGDGIQQIIILTIPLFLHRDKHLLLFIEEPELYLHPGYQRRFIEAVLDETECKGRQVFVATHAHQFLDITIDSEAVSVYKFKKVLGADDKAEQVPKFEITNSSNEDFALLAELGVRNSAVLLANCTIWVEGITDRLYIRKYLELYQAAMELKQDGGKPKQFFEDIHFAFVEYGGSNITHWSFLDESGEGIDPCRVCGQLFLIADKDSETKVKRHDELTKALGERFYCLSCREIENTLEQSIVQKVIHGYEGDEVSLKPVAPKKYAKQPLGKLINEEILPAGWLTGADRKTRHRYASASGTINEKVDFARNAISHLTSVSDLSEETIGLCKRLYDFIDASNR